MPKCRINLYDICHTLELGGPYYSTCPPPQGLDFLTMLAPEAGPAK